MKFKLRVTFTNMALLLGFLCACSTISKRQSLQYPYPAQAATQTFGKKPIDVDRELESKYLADASNEVLFIQTRYQQAKLWGPIDPVKSCALWNDVLKQKRFPLYAVARVHASEVCKEESVDLASVQNLIDGQNEPWTEEVVVRSALRRVIKYGKTLESKKQELALSPRVAKFEKVATDRVKLHQRALELSKEIGNEEEAAQAQIRLEETAPRFLKEPKPEQFAAVASDLRKNRDFNEARAMYGKIIASAEASDLEKLSALDGIRMSFKLENRVDDYIAATHTFSEFARVHFLLPGLRSFKKDRSGARALLGRYLETQMILARAVWTDNSPGKARVILQAAERDVKNKIPVAESVFTRARIEEEAGRYDQTLKLLSGIDLAEVDNRELRTKILWYHAWNLRKAKKLEDAEKALRTLVSEDESVTSTTSRNRFWFGKTLQQLKKDDEAKAQFEILAEKDRVGWYGLLAYRELVRPFPKMTVVETRGPASEKNEEAALLPDESLTFEWLIATGENDLGLSFLEHTLKNKRAGFNNAQTLDALRLYARAGSFQTVFTRIQELPADTRTAILDTNPELMFPQPWTPVVAAAAGKFNLPSELIYSIMRQESAFNPLARSGADAFGLMQLIPMAAKKASATSGIPFDHHEELYTPETNIPLGASFIKGLLKNWNDGFIPTVASYNASDKAIAGWIRSRYRGDILEFIEDVPYEETRTYIKLVMRNYVFYRRLNAGQAEIYFPEWCLAALQDTKS